MRSQRNLLGLAPDGVYRAPECHHRGGGLLPHLFTVTRACPGRLFSVALSSARAESLLATVLPCGVRTFLPFTGHSPEEAAVRSALDVCLSSLPGLLYYTQLFRNGFFLRIPQKRKPHLPARTGYARRIHTRSAYRRPALPCCAAAEYWCSTPRRRHG